MVLLLCRLDCWDKVCWQPAAAHIDDVPRLWQVLQDIIDSPQAAPLDPLEQQIAKMPALRQLSSAHCFKLLTHRLDTDQHIPAAFWDLPGVQQLDVQQIRDLLCWCVPQHLSSELSALVQLPACSTVPPALIEELVQHLLQGLPTDQSVPHGGPAAVCCAKLLSLPQAATFPIEVVQQMYDTALDMGLAGMVKTILTALPLQAAAVRVATGEQLIHGIRAAINRIPSGGDLLLWAQEPGLQVLDADGCVQLVLALLHFSGTLDKTRSALKADISDEADSSLVPLQLMQLLQTVLQSDACRHMQTHHISNVVNACLWPDWCKGCGDSLQRTCCQPDQAALWSGANIPGIQGVLLSPALCAHDPICNCSINSNSRYQVWSFAGSHIRGL